MHVVASAQSKLKLICCFYHTTVSLVTDKLRRLCLLLELTIWVTCDAAGPELAQIILGRPASHPPQLLLNSDGSSQMFSGCCLQNYSCISLVDFLGQLPLRMLYAIN